MVTAEEARRQVDDATRATQRSRADLQRQQQQVSRLQKQLQQAPSKTQLLKQTRQQKITSQAQIRKSLAEVKGQQKLLSARASVISSFEKQLGRAAKTVRAAESELADFQRAKQAADSRSPFASLGLETDRQQDFFKQIRAGQQAFKRRTDILKGVGNGSFKEGIKKFKAQQQVLKEFGRDLSKLEIKGLSPKQLITLSEAGFVRAEALQSREPISFDPLKRLASSELQRISPALEAIKESERVKTFS